MPWRFLSAIVMVTIVINVTSRSFGASQRAPAEILRSLVFRSPHPDLSKTPRSALKPIRLRGIIGWVLPARSFEASTPNDPVTKEQADAAFEFMNNSIELMRTHYYNGPRSFLTPGEAEILERSLLNAAHVWLSYHKVQHTLFMFSHTQAGLPVSWELGLRIMPGTDSKLARRAAELKTEGLDLIFQPDLAQFRDDARRSIPENLYPHQVGSGLSFIHPPRSFETLTVDQLVHPRTSREEMAFVHRFLNELHEEVKNGRLRELVGFAVSRPLPIDSHYMARYLEDWYGLRRTQIPEDQAFDSPWISELWFTSVDIDVHRLVSYLKSQKPLLKDASELELQTIFNELRSRADALMRKIAHANAITDKGLRFPLTQMPPGEPFVWHDHHFTKWVRMTVPSEQLTLKEHKRVKRSIRFVLPLMMPGKLGIKLNHDLTPPELHDLIMAQLNLIKKTLANCQVWAQWILDFTREPINRPEWNLHDSGAFKNQYLALADAIQVPQRPLQKRFQPLSRSVLDQNYETALAHLRISFQAQEKCSDEF